MRKIKIAQIGTSLNSHGNMVFDSIKKNDDIFEIAGYVMPENEREKFPQNMPCFEEYSELTLDEVMNNPEIEAVAVETEEKYLTKYALMAAKHNKHIHMEKPGGLNFNEFNELISIMKNNKKIFHTGYMYRYNPYIIELKEQIKNGDLGEIISVEAQMNCIHKKEVRDWLGNFPGGMMFFLGCHLIDLIFSIQGTPKKIIPLNKCSGIDGITAEDFGMVIFEYEKGYSFAKASAVEMGGFERRQLVVSGTKKTVEIKPLEWFVEGGTVSVKCDRDSSVWQEKGKVETSALYKRYEPMMINFAKMVAGEKSNPQSYEYELELYKLIMEACSSEKYIKD